MAKERLKSPRARLFVALDLPDRVRVGLEAWQARALTDPALRPVDPEALHVTLCFLGYHPERAIESVASEVTAIGSRPVEIRFEADPAPVPAERPRLFAARGRAGRPRCFRRSWRSGSSRRASTSPRSASSGPT